jgi:hypothetical protein
MFIAITALLRQPRLSRNSASLTGTVKFSAVDTMKFFSLYTVLITSLLQLYKATVITVYLSEHVRLIACSVSVRVRVTVRVRVRVRQSTACCKRRNVSNGVQYLHH